MLFESINSLATMTPRTTTEYRRNWFFRRSRIRAQKEWYERFLRSRKSNSMRRKARRRSVMLETLEPRVLFSATPAPEAPPENSGDEMQETQAASAQGDAIMDDSDAGIEDSEGESTEVSHDAVNALARIAAERWLEAGISAEQYELLLQVDYRLEDLDPGRLGVAEGMDITIDTDANGSDWFIDETPFEDEEFFATDGEGLAFEAHSGSGVDSRYDLLTVLLHEQGHILGLFDQPEMEEALMQGLLEQGQRLLPAIGEAEDAIAGAVEGPAYITAASPNPDVGVRLAEGQPAVYIGDDEVEFEITFDNNTGQTGYSPYIDLIVPSRGSDGAVELFSANQWEDTNGLAGMVDLSTPAQRTGTLPGGGTGSTDRFGPGIDNFGRLEYTAGMGLENPSTGGIVSLTSQGLTPGDPLLQFFEGSNAEIPVGNYVDVNGDEIGIPARWSTDPAEFNRQMAIVFGGTTIFDVGNALEDFMPPSPGDVIYDASAYTPANVLQTRVGNDTFNIVVNDGTGRGVYILDPSTAPLYNIATIQEADNATGPGGVELGGLGSLDFEDQTTAGGVTNWTDTDMDGAFDWLDLDPNDPLVGVDTYFNTANGTVDSGGNPVNPFPDGIGNATNFNSNGLDLSAQDLVHAVTFVDTDGDGIGEAHHPLFGDRGDPDQVTVYGRPGDILYAIQMPFGSFTDGQPEEVISFTADVSNMADPDQALTFFAAGGYLLGCDEFDNHIDETPVDADGDGDTDYINYGVSDPPVFALPPAETPVLSRLDPLDPDYVAPIDPTDPYPAHVAEFSITPTLIDVHKHVEGFPDHLPLGIGPNQEQTFHVNVSMAVGQTFHSFIIDDDGPDDAIVKQIQLQQANPSGPGMVDMDFNTVAFVEYFDEHGQTHVFYNPNVYSGAAGPSIMAPTPINAGSADTPTLPAGVEYVPFTYSTSTFFTGSLQQEVLVGDYETDQNNPTVHTGPGAGVANTFLIPLELQHPGNNFKLTFHNEDLDMDGDGDSEIVGQKHDYIDGLGRIEGDLVVSYDIYYSEFGTGVTGTPTTLIDQNDVDNDGHADGIDDEHQVGTGGNPRQHGSNLVFDANGVLDQAATDALGGGRETNEVQVSPIYEGIDPRDGADPVRLNENLNADTSDPVDVNRGDGTENEANTHTINDVPNLGGSADSTDAPWGTNKTLKVLNPPDFQNFDDPDRNPNDNNGLANVGSIQQWEINFGISDFVAIANLRVGESVTDVSNPDHRDYDPLDLNYNPALDPTNAAFDWDAVLTDAAGQISGDRLSDGQRLLFGEFNPADAEYAALVAAASASVLAPGLDLTENGGLATTGLITSGGTVDFTPEIQLSGYNHFNSAVGQSVDEIIKFDEQNWSFVRNTDSRDANGFQDSTSVNQGAAGSGGSVTSPFTGATPTEQFTGETFINFDVTKQLFESGYTEDAGVGGALIGALYFENDDVVVYDNDQHLNTGQTQITIRYWTVVEDQYLEHFPSGNPSLNEGEGLRNEYDLTWDIVESRYDDDDADDGPNGTGDEDPPAIDPITGLPVDSSSLGDEEPDTGAGPGEDGGHIDPLLGPDGVPVFDLTNITHAGGGGSEGVPIAIGRLDKSLFAVRGDTDTSTWGLDNFAGPDGNLGVLPRVQPGDSVTYRITQTFPVADFEDFIIADFLPSPIYDVTRPDFFFDTSSPTANLWTAIAGINNPANAGTVPAVGEFSFGPDHGKNPAGVVDTDLFAITPDVGHVNTGTGAFVGGSVDAANNQVAFNFGNYDDSENDGITVDIMFTLTASGNPMTDELFLTNKAQSQQGDTFDGIQAVGDIVLVQIESPELQIQKGIVDVDRTSRFVTGQDGDGIEFIPEVPNSAIQPPTYVGALPETDANGDLLPDALGPVDVVAWMADPTLGGGPVDVITSDRIGYDGEVFTGINSPIDADAVGVDNGDLVTFAVTIVNTGHADAFDVAFSDSFSGNYQVPGGGINLQVRDGLGNVIVVDSLTVDPVSGEIVAIFEDPADALGTTDPTQQTGVLGGLDVNDTSDGNNVLIVTYQLVVSDALAADPTTNTATLEAYRSRNGADYTDDNTDGDLFNDQEHFLSTGAKPSDIANVIAVPSVDKRLIPDSDSQSNTYLNDVDGFEVVVGETFDYEVEIELIEGRISNLSLRDVLDEGLGFVPITPGGSQFAEVELVSEVFDGAGILVGQVIHDESGNFVNAFAANGTTPITQNDLETASGQAAGTLSYLYGAATHVTADANNDGTAGTFLEETELATSQAFNDRTAVFQIGDVENINLLNFVSEKIRFTYKVVARDHQAINAGDLKNNSATIFWDTDPDNDTTNNNIPGGQSVSVFTDNDTAEEVLVLEPQLEIEKTVVEDPNAPGSFVYELVIRHREGANGSSAYDLSLADPIPPGMDPATVNILSAVKTDVNGVTSNLLTNPDVGTVIQNEIQELNSVHITGNFTIEFDGVTTASIPSNATAALIQTELEGLPNIGAGNVLVTGGPFGTAPISVEFIGSLQDTNVVPLIIDDSNLSGGVTATLVESAPAGIRNEIQTISSTATSGTFQLEFNGNVSPTVLNFNATATDILNALAAIPAYNTADFVVNGGPLGTADVTVEFTGALANLGQPEITFSNSTLDGVQIVEETRSADGNEVQTLDSNYVGGTFTLTFNGQTTFDLPYNAPPARIQAALEDLPNIDPGDVIVTGGDLTFNPINIEFAGNFAGADQPLITIDTTSLVGVSVEETQAPQLQFLAGADIDLLHVNDATVADNLDNEFITIRYSVAIDPDVVEPGDIVVNTATIEWTSIDGDPGQVSSFYPDATERTGDPSDPGSFNNDHIWADSASVLIPGQSFTKEIGSLNADGEKTLTENMRWDFTSGQPDGWTLVNGPIEWRPNDGGGVRAGGDPAHDNLLFTSPSFQLDGSTIDGTNVVSVELAGGQGDQNSLGAIYNTPADILSANGGTTSSMGQKGFAIFNVSTGTYEAHFFKSGNGGTETINVPPTSFSDPNGVYQIHFYDTDDGGWGWGQLNDVQIARHIDDPTSFAHTQGTDLTIGETIDYVLTASFENGDLGGVVITDHLPVLDGTMEYVANSYQIRIGSNLDSSSLNEALHVDPTTRLVNAAGIAHLLANGFFTETDSNGDGINDEIAWNFGSVSLNVATATDTQENQIQIALQAQVKQDTDNSGSNPVDGDIVQGLRGRYMYAEIGGGLTGEQSGINNALRIVNSQDPTAEFLVHEGIAYQSGGGALGGGNLIGFFGNDLPAGLGSGSTDDHMIVNLEGFIEIEPSMDQDPFTAGIQVDFELFADNGAALWIDGVQLLNLQNGSGSVTHTFATAGLHRLQTVMYNQGGDANLTLELNGSTDYGDSLFHQGENGTLQRHLNGEYYDLVGGVGLVQEVIDRFDNNDYQAEFVSLTASHTGGGSLGGFLGTAGVDYDDFHQPLDKDIGTGIVTGMTDESLLGLNADRILLHLDGVVQINAADDLDGDLGNGIQVEFITPSDDGTQLFINNDLAVNNDGGHGAPGPGAGPEVYTFTHEGLHELDLYYFEGAGGESLQMQMNTAGGTLSGASLAPRLFHQSSMSGDILTNVATMSSTAGVVSDSVDVEVVEPELELKKLVEDPVTGALVDFDAPPVGDAGDVFTYHLSIEHTADSTADAFDLVIQDLLNDPRLELVPGSVEINGGAGVNVALAGTATQSSTAGGAAASRAIDGNTDGNFGASSTTHTGNEVDAWWQVDLGSSVDINQIVLFNRTDCCGDRLSNFRVSVWDGDPNATGTELWGQDYFDTGHVSQGGPFALNGLELSDTGVQLADVSGQFVRVQYIGENNAGAVGAVDQNFLSLAEVQVFETPTTTGVSIGGGSTVSVNVDEYPLGPEPLIVSFDVRMTDAIQADATDPGSQEKVLNTATLQYDNIAGAHDEQRIITDEDVAFVAGVAPSIEKTVFSTQFTQTGIADGKEIEGLAVHYEMNEANGATTLSDATGNTTATVAVANPSADDALQSVVSPTGTGLNFQGDVFNDVVLADPDFRENEPIATATGAILSEVNNVETTDGFTVATWVEGSPDQPFFSRLLDLPGSFEFFLRDDGRIYFRIHDGVGGSTDVNSGASLVFDNSWHHVAATIQYGTTTNKGDNSSVTLYVDGQVAATTTGLDLSAAAGATGNLTIGARNNNDPAFDGSLDDLRIYTQALTQEEIACLAPNHGAGPGFADAGFEDAVQDGLITSNGQDEVSIGSEESGLGLISSGWIFNENAGVTDTTTTEYGSLAIGSGQVGLLNGDDAEMSQTVEGFTIGDTYQLNFDAIARSGVDSGELIVEIESLDGTHTETINLGNVQDAGFSGAATFTAQDGGYHVSVRSQNTVATGMVQTIYDVLNTGNPTLGNVVGTPVATDGPIAGNVQNGTGPWAVIGSNETIVYTGEFFDEDGIFAFAENIDDQVRIYIDGVLVLGNNTWNVATTTTSNDGYRTNSGTVGQVVGGQNFGTPNLDFGMGPNGDGWHKIEIRFGNGAGGAGASGQTGGTLPDWTTSFGFGLADPASGNTADLPTTADGEFYEVPEGSRFRSVGDGVILVDNFSFTNISPEPQLDQVVVGELVTYHITVDVPEGRTENLVITDDLNISPLTEGTLTFANAFIVEPGSVTGAELSAGQIGNFLQGDGSALEVGEVTINTVAGVTTFDFGSVVAPGDNDVTNNTITVAVQAYVSDTAGNDDGDNFVNTATLNYDALVDDVLVEQELTDTAEIELVEPDVYILKGVTGDNLRYPVPIADSLVGATPTIGAGAGAIPATGPVSVEVGVTLPNLFPASPVDQVIWEAGGSTGMSLNLIDGNRVQLSVRELQADGMPIIQTIEAELPASLSGQFAQFVTTVDPATDALQLFINGSHIASATLTDLTAWSDGAGFSQGTISTDATERDHGGVEPLGQVGQMANFAGSISQLRVYSDLLTDREVENNYYSQVGIPSGDAGDVFSYTLDIAHHGDMDATAFDLNIADTFSDPGIMLDDQTVVVTVFDAAGNDVTATAAPVVASGNGAGDTSISVTLAELNPEWSVRVTFDGLLSPSAGAGENYDVVEANDESIPNIATVAWDSNPLDPGDSGFHDERDGVGDNDDAHVETGIQVDFEKVIVATSLTETGSSQHNAAGDPSNDADHLVNPVNLLSDNFTNSTIDGGDIGNGARQRIDDAVAVGASDGSWVKRDDSAWEIVNGRLQNVSLSGTRVGEAATGTVIDLSSITNTDLNQIELSFDYSLGDPGERLYVHLWGYVENGTPSNGNTFLLNTEAANGAAWESSGAALDQHNISLGGVWNGPNDGGPEDAIVLTGTSGPQHFNQVFDLSEMAGGAPVDLSNYDYLVLGFARNINGVNSAVAIDNLVLNAGEHLEDDYVDVTIGETVTYKLNATLGEGTYEDLVIEDVLPPGFELVSATIEDPGGTFSVLEDITVPNFSFEANNAATGGAVPGSPTGWLLTGPGGTYEPTAGDFTSLAPLASPADGDQYSYLESGGVGGTASLTSAASLGTTTAGVTYELTVAAGHRDFDSFGGRRPDDYTIEILVDGTPVSSTSLSDGHSSITSGGWTNLSTSFTAASSGGDITVRLTHSSDDVSFRQGAFDNVRLTAATPITAWNSLNSGAGMTATGEGVLTLDETGAQHVATFDFGNVVNTGAIGTNTDTFSICVVTRPTDHTAVVDGATGTNTATLTTEGETRTDIAVVDIVEPELQVDKFVSNQNNFISSFYGLNDNGDPVVLDSGAGLTGGGGDGDSDSTINDFTISALGETIIYRVEFNHTTDSTAAAHNVRILDTIDNMAADGFGTIVPGSLVVIDTVTNLPVTAFTDNSTDSVVDITLDDPFLLGSRYAVEFLVELGGDISLLNRGGIDGIDVENTVDLIYSTAPENGRELTDSDTAELAIVAPDLKISKDNGLQTRVIGEQYDYLIRFENQEFHDDGVSMTAPARNTIITDILPTELEHNATSVTIGSVAFPLTLIATPSYDADGDGISDSPSAGEYMLINNPDGTSTVIINVGDLNPGEKGELTMTVTVAEDAFSIDDDDLGAFTSILTNAVSISNEFLEPDLADNSDVDVDELRAPDLFIEKNNGIQDREEGEVYSYTLNFGNKLVHDDGVSPTGFARNVVITDLLPPELAFDSLTVSVNGAPVDVNAIIVIQPNGSLAISFDVGDLQPGDIGEVIMQVSVLEDIQSTEILNEVSITNDFGEPDDDTDNRDFDLDRLPASFFGGSSILQGFRYEDPGFRFEEEEDPLAPILELMPIYSGLADPGTVLRIKVMGDTGAPLPNGDMTVVADAGGNWLAKFPGLILREEPHMIVIEQTAPTWNTGNKEHGFNFRTYFAPAISPTHAQMEEINVGDTLARRLSAVVIDSMSSHDEDNSSHSNSDWRLANYEWFCQSGIGGVLR